MPIDLSSDALLADLARLAAAEHVPAALVGGAVRDLILGREPADFDLVVDANPMPFARRIARELGGKAVELDAEWGIARVALPGGRIVDLAKQQGDRLEVDLLRRDLALNALAIPLDGSRAMIDPAGGQEDLARRRVRAISLENLMADPVRPLRVLRFAATLGFAIDPETLAWVEIARHRLKDAAPERATPELMRILALPDASLWVDRLLGLGIWDLLIPELLPLAQIPPTLEQHLDGLAHSLETVRQLDQIIATLESWAPHADRIHAWLETPASHAPKLKALLTLGALVHDLGKHSRVGAGVVGAFGEPVFQGHEEEGERLMLTLAERLRLSVKEREHLQRLVGLHHQSLDVIRQGLDAVAIYQLFERAGETTPGMLLLALANRRASRGLAVSDAEIEALTDGLAVLFRSYWREDARFTAPPRFVSGADLQRLGLPPGPAYARILRAVTEATVRGDVPDRESALALARSLAERPNE